MHRALRAATSDKAAPAFHFALLWLWLLCLDLGYTASSKLVSQSKPDTAAAHGGEPPCCRYAGASVRQRGVSDINLKIKEIEAFRAVQKRTHLGS